MQICWSLIYAKIAISGVLVNDLNIFDGMETESVTHMEFDTVHLPLHFIFLMTINY
jgi:hypothetical protein